MTVRISNPTALFRIAGVLPVLFLTAPSSAAIKPEQLIVGGGINEVFDSDGHVFGSAELRFKPLAGGLRPWIHGSLSTEGGVFAGAGLAYTFASEKCPWTASIGFGPGYYHDGDDVFLGGDFEMMSFAEVACRLKNGTALGLRISHLSNGGAGHINPGTEMVSLQYSIPMPGGAR